MNGRLWAPAIDGIYFADKTRQKILFLSFDNHRTTEVLTLNKKINTNLNRELALSPDGKHIIWSQADSQDFDIALVENFR